MLCFHHFTHCCLRYVAFNPAVSVVASVNPEFLVWGLEYWVNELWWNRSVWHFFFVFGFRETSGDPVVVLLREELLSEELTDDMSVSKLSLDDPRLLVEDRELLVSSSFQGVLIEYSSNTTSKWKLLQIKILAQV